MLYTKEQVMNGITSYIDSEVVSKLPTAGKWIVGTASALALKKAMNIDDQSLKMLGIVNADGLWDIDQLAAVLKENASRYGNIQISLPVVGLMTFTQADIDLVRSHII